MHNDDLSITDEVLETLNKRLELALVHAKLEAIELLQSVIRGDDFPNAEERIMAASALLMTMPAIEVQQLALERIEE
jgi:hypothetical protein